MVSATWPSRKARERKSGAAGAVETSGMCMFPVEVRWVAAEAAPTGIEAVGAASAAMLCLFARTEPGLGRAAEAVVRFRCQPCEHGVRGKVLRQVGRIDLVERVVRVVVQVEVLRTVLAQPRPGAANRGERRDVRSRSALARHVRDAERGQRFGDPRDGPCVAAAGVEAVDAAGA